MNLYDHLCKCIEEKNWNEFSSIIKPIDFAKNKTGTLVNPKILAKIAESLTTKTTETSEEAKIILLKCLMNSCVNGYLHKSYNTKGDIDNLYSTYLLFLCDVSKEMEESKKKNIYPYETHFPYEDIAIWAVNVITFYENTENNESKQQMEITRLSLQFICNLITFSCKTMSLPEHDNYPKCLEMKDFKNSLIKLITHKYMPISVASCALIHNMLAQVSATYYNEDEKKELVQQLLKAVRAEGIQSATDTIICIIKESNNLNNIYEELHIEEKLLLLEIISNYVSEFAPNDTDAKYLPTDAVQFLSDTFKRKSDTILKTVDTYVNNIEPAEVTILLDILGSLTSTVSKNSKHLQGDKSLLINCIFLLKSIHMAGKDANNFFTPVQKLSELTSSTQNHTDDPNVKLDSSDIEKHPAFAFKVGLIRVIGNMTYKHKESQNLLRETDSIPLLLDCCTIDARNPLIIQWTILAIRNLCEGNLENQEIIRNCTKIGVVHSAVLHELGITLHTEEDGKTIGIVPLTKT